jgi:hypothetical protein
VPIVLKSGSLNVLEPSRPDQACTGIALPLPELIYQPATSMDQNTPSKANRSSTSHEIPCVLRKRQPTTRPYPEPDESNPHQPFYFFKMLLNIILPSMSSSSKLSHDIRFSTSTCMYFFFPHMSNILCPP